MLYLSFTSFNLFRCRHLISALSMRAYLPEFNLYRVLSCSRREVKWPETSQIAISILSLGLAGAI